MADCKDKVAGLTQISFSDTSSPSLAHLTEFLNEGIKDFTNKIITVKPQEAYKFAHESSAADDNGIEVRGRVLSVAREHDSTSILRPCTPMPADFRYEATDVNSLHYRSKYNPGWYILNKKIYVRPAAAGSNNAMKVSHIIYGTTAHDRVMGSWTNFSEEYEDAVILYAAAMSCNAKAQDIQNNLPSKPDAPLLPDFTKDFEELPSLPIFTPPKLLVDFSGMSRGIGMEDFELVDKQATLFDKKIEAYSKQYESENNLYQRDLEIFKSELDKNLKDSDRLSSVEATEFKSELERYTAEIQHWQSLLQEKTTQYKWYQEQYFSYMSQYHTVLGINVKKPKAKEEKESKEKKEDK